MAYQSRGGPIHISKWFSLASRGIWGFLLPFWIITLGVLIAMGVMTHVLEGAEGTMDDSIFAAFGLGGFLLVFLLISLLVSVLIVFSVQAIDRSIDVAEAFSVGVRVAPKMWASWFLSLLIIGIFGLIGFAMALIAPPAYFVVTFLANFIVARLALAPFFIVDKDAGPVAALMASWVITEGRTIRMLAALLLLQVITVAGMLACGVGLLFTAPFSMLALAGGYRVLVNEAERWRRRR